MQTNTGSATVIHLESHPAWRSAQRRTHEIAEAMRRHPSFQSRLEPVAGGNAVVHRLGAH